MLRTMGVFELIVMGGKVVCESVAVWDVCCSLGLKRKGVRIGSGWEKRFAHVSELG